MFGPKDLRGDFSTLQAVGSTKLPWRVSIWYLFGLTKLQLVISGNSQSWWLWWSILSTKLDHTEIDTTAVKRMKGDPEAGGMPEAAWTSASACFIGWNYWEWRRTAVATPGLRLPGPFLVQTQTFFDQSGNDEYHHIDQQVAEKRYCTMCVCLWATPNDSTSKCSARTWIGVIRYKHDLKSKQWHWDALYIYI